MLLRRIAALLILLFGNQFCLADDPVFSGPQPGETLGPFLVVAVYGEDAGKEVEWVSYDHPLHGYIFPVRADDGDYHVDAVAAEAIETVVTYLAGYLSS